MEYWGRDLPGGAPFLSAVSDGGAATELVDRVRSIDLGPRILDLAAPWHSPAAAACAARLVEIGDSHRRVVALLDAAVLVAG
ncbi:hypothetical protein [Mycetocola reblochoni]|uniref:Uncharacterized protein n=2 Tax=Mycetocola reblochoni TaxID=331618 RepID=A0A1R4JLT9_9MICO|nr:hypothetical protein [Mycetocola reblochoni]RLP68583.1 hypothetical protein D9V30_09925 [Mycetocola reblochoni]SJN33221.1 hypothetical protein FM119_08305 [Mycetocola reblochoni REB411]